MLTFSIEAVRKVIARGIADANTNVGFPISIIANQACDWLATTASISARTANLPGHVRSLSTRATRECDPSQNDDGFDIKRHTFGGDDGVDFIGAVALERWMSTAPDATHVRISMDDNAMTIDPFRL